MAEIQTYSNVITITVNTTNTTTTVEASQDFTSFWMEMFDKVLNLVKDWAVKCDGKVNNEDYSAKYYANRAKVSEQNAENSAASALEASETAQESSETSVEKAQEANTSAASATSSAGIALNKADEANTSAASAALSSSIAQTKAEEANQSAISAAASAASIDIARFNSCRIYDSGSSQDSIGYSKVYDLKHSLFDSDKITVVGNPVITEDGVVSELNSSNYLTTGITLGQAQSWEIKIENFKYSSKTSADYCLLVGTQNSNGLKFFMNEGFKNFQLQLSSDGTNADIGVSDFGLYSSLSLEENDILNILIKFTGSEYIVSIKNVTKNIESTTTVTSSVTIYDSEISIGSFRPVNGSVDLKAFSIKADGEEVYNCLKTGMDTVKPNDYTVVGNPTITDDGIASGFSSSDYLTLSSIPFNTNWEIKFKFLYKSASTAQTPLAITNNSNNKTILRLWCRGNSNGGQIVPYYDDGVSFQVQPFILTNNNTYIYSIKNNAGSSITSTVVNSDTGEIVYSDTISGHDYNLTSTTARIKIGVNDTAGEAIVSSIDLNAFKIYVDGQLAYQPCLKIPYTEAKTGAKIVDAQYRDRVQDWYEQSGEGSYYTIDEEVKDFTLPLPDLYGLVENKTECKANLSDVFYKPGDVFTNTERFSCYGFVTSATKEINVIVVLPKSIANINNISVLSLKTSIRISSGGYTPSSGDTDMLNNSSTTIQVFKASSNIVLIQLMRNSAWPNVTNNTPLIADFCFPGYIALQFD